MTIQNNIFYSFIIALIFISCRSEEIIQFNPDVQIDNITAESSVSGLIKNMAMLDGSIDNVIDNANCFIIKLPYSVTVNGNTMNVSSLMDYTDIEEIVEDFAGISVITIDFPVTIQFDDYTTREINNIVELNLLALECNGENVDDLDIECLDFEYPLNITKYNTLNEQLNKVKVSSDIEMYELVNALSQNELANFDFPIRILLYDESVIITENLAALENLIEARKNDCDEDDDFDYSDNECLICTPTNVLDILTSCSDWTIEKLKRSDIDELENLYTNFTFNFVNDGTLTAFDGIITYPGTWSQTDIGGEVGLLIDIPLLPQFNLNWPLHHIHDDYHEDRKDVEFRVGSSDKLKFRSECGL